MHKDPILRILADLREYADVKTFEAEELRKRLQNAESKIMELENRLEFLKLEREEVE